MILVGIDSGIKSFAVTIIEVKKSNFHLLTMKVFDLFDDGNTKKMKLTDSVKVFKNLKKILTELDSKYLKKGEYIKILTEFQLGPNVKSKKISTCCIYHFVDKYDVEIIYPGLKTKYTFKQELDLGSHIERYATNYTAQKKCAINNMLYWLNENNLKMHIKNIKKKNLDDIADSFMMIYGWLKKKNIHSLDKNIKINQFNNNCN